MTLVLGSLSDQEIVALAGGVSFGWFVMWKRLRQRDSLVDLIVAGAIGTVIGGLVLAAALGGLNGLFSGDGKLTQTTAARFVPANGSDLSRGIRIELAQEADRCVRSYVDPNREDALRCWAGQTVGDPCFYLPNQKLYVCYPNPWVRTTAYNRDYVQNAFFLKQAPPRLPRSVIEDWSIPWAIELESGNRCLRLETHSEEYPVGTTYGCEEGWLFGLPDLSSQPWSVEFQLPGASAFETVPMATVWI